MAHVFIFAEQVRAIVRAGKSEIDIPEGARITSAAADLIKEKNIRINTIAPGGTPVSPDHDERADKQSTAEVEPAQTREQEPGPLKDTHHDATSEAPADITEAELDEIVDHVLKRFKELKTDESKSPGSPSPAKAILETGTAADGDDLVICRCEEITRKEIKDAIRNGIQTLNGVKRVTRAGMGLCQGQTCQQLVARILTEELGLNAADIDPTTARGPVRPLRLEVFANS